MDVKQIGWIFIGIGASIVLWAFLIFDTTVAVDAYTRVNNLGLLNDQRNYSMLGGFVVVIGIFFLFRTEQKPKQVDHKNQAPISSQSDSEVFVGIKSIDNDAYKIYLVKKYCIEKNMALGKFIVGDKLFNSIEEALSYASGVDEIPTSSHAQNKDTQNINHQNRKIIDSEDTLNYGVTLKNGKFIYKDYSYDNLQDAINYAKLDLAKISQTTKSDLSSSPSFSGDDDLEKFGIIFKDGSFLFKNLSFGNRQDAINYAKSDLAK